MQQRQHAPPCFLCSNRSVAQEPHRQSKQSLILGQTYWRKLRLWLCSEKANRAGSCPTASSPSWWSKEEPSAVHFHAGGRGTAHSSPNASGWGPALEQWNSSALFLLQSKQADWQGNLFLIIFTAQKGAERKNTWKVSDWQQLIAEVRQDYVTAVVRKFKNLSSTNGSPELYVHISVCKSSVTPYTLWALGYCTPAPHTSSNQSQERQLSCFITFTWNLLLQERILIWNTALAWRVLHCFKHKVISEHFISHCRRQTEQRLL